MKRFKYYKVLPLFLCLVLVTCLSGCQPSKKKVVNSTYYKELKKENKKLRKKVKELEGKVEKENNISEDTKRAEDYLSRIARDHIIKMEIGYADNMEGSEFISDNPAVFAMATSVAVRADECSRYKVEEIEEMYGPGYEYILYDEDNACYEVKIYGGNYVVFLDLPDRVYYSYDASALGEAFLHYKEGYPNSKLLHRFADSPFITDNNDNYYDRTTAYKVANAIDRMDKEDTDKKKAVKDWGKTRKGKSWTFYHHGNQMKLTLYDKYIRLENMDGKATWYKVTEEEVDKLKGIFKGNRNPGKSETISKNSGGDTQQNHYEEMGTEGDQKEEESTETEEYYDEDGSEG